CLYLNGMYLELAYATRIVFETDAHNLRGVIDIPILHKDHEGTFTTVVINTGFYTETVSTHFIINNSELENSTFTLIKGTYTFIHFTWTPPQTGLYNITFTIDTVGGELYLLDNKESLEAHVYELRNYQHYIVPSTWYDAKMNGQHLQLSIGEELVKVVSLPFPFIFYGLEFNEVGITPFGRLSFEDSKS
ncbi:unnamed protein product, partial [marine sediment metagenome]